MASPILLLVPLVAALWPAPTLPRATETITLLPNADGRPSAVVVRSAKGETVIDRPYLSASVFAGGAVTPKDEEPAYVKARYSATLSALPEAAAVYVVYFGAGTDMLMPESAERIKQIRTQLARRAEPEIALVGHTDRVDMPGYNDELSLRRAAAIKRMLVAAGIADERIATIGRGERELLVKTRDGTIEQSNRRVEIRVR
jgi:outer membrane protein OmpA-like peptidoglycan-associated protein